MAIKKTFLGVNEDGSPHFHYESDGHLVLTGPHYGLISVEDGTEYDISDPVIEVDSHEHGIQVANAIDARIASANQEG